MAKANHIQFRFPYQLEIYSNQSEILNSDFLYYSYDVTWLGESIAAFMTKEFVAVPFEPVVDYPWDIAQGNESWTAATRVYQTYVDCVPATIVESSESNGTTYNFTTSGCHYSFDPLADPNATRNLIYIGYGQGDVTPWYLHESECTVKNIFLGVWAKSRLSTTRGTDIDVAGIFCRTRYSYADALITVDRTHFDIIGFSVIGEPKPLTAEDEIIDIDLFERYLGAGSANYSVESSSPFSFVAPTAQVRYEDWNLWFPTVQVGYAIGLESKTFDDFRDPRIFGDAMNKTHKLLFNYAVESLLLVAEQPQQINGTSTVLKDGIVVVPEVAHLLAGFLSAVAVCLAGVFFLSYNRHNNLRSDPDTLATKMSLVAQSSQLLRDFDGADNCPDIDGCIKRRRYKLWDGEDSHRLDIVAGSDATLSGDSHESSTKPHDGQGIRPWILSAGAGAGITIFSTGLLVLLAVLFWSSRKYSGRRPPRSLSQY